MKINSSYLTFILVFLTIIVRISIQTPLKIITKNSNKKPLKYQSSFTTSKPLKKKIAPYTKTFLDTYNPNSNAWNISFTNVLDSYYTTSVSFGTCSHTFNMIADTGISYTWIPDNNMISQGYTNTFNCTNSTTCITEVSEIEQFTFYQGSINGTILSDTINIGNNKQIKSQDIISASYIDQTYSDNRDLINVNEDNYGYDGYIGLGLNSSISSNYTTFLDNLITNGYINSKWFTMFYTIDPENLDDYTEIIFEGWNDTHFQNSSSNPLFNYTNISSNSSWTIALSNITYGGYSLTNSTTALIATGYPYIGIDMQSFQTFWDILVYDLSIQCRQDSMQYNDTTRIICSCNNGDVSNFPNLQMNVGNITLQIPPQAYTQYLGYYFDFEESYTIGYDDENLDECMLNIYPIIGSFGFNNPQYYQTWILGTPLLRNYYTLFDADNMVIGFANALQTTYIPSISYTGGIYNMLEILGGILLAMLIIIAIVRICKPARVARNNNNNNNEYPNEEYLNGYQIS